MIRSFHGLFSRCRIIQQKYIAYPGAVACGWSSSPGIVREFSYKNRVYTKTHKEQFKKLFEQDMKLTETDINITK